MNNYKKKYSNFIHDIMVQFVKSRGVNFMYAGFTLSKNENYF